MERQHQKDENPIVGIAALIAVGAMMDYMNNESRNIIKAIEWYHWLASGALQANVAATMPTLNTIAGGFIVVAAGIVLIRMAGSKMSEAKEATAPAQTDEPFDKAASLARKQLASAVGPTVGLPKRRSGLMRKGARLVR